MAQLQSVETYRILSQSGCTTLDGVDDAAQFRGVQNAFDTIGMEAQAQMQVMFGGLVGGCVAETKWYSS